MKVYHGSNVAVINPLIMKSERKLDFGEGFYTTFNREQAVRWSERVTQREKTINRVITEYEFKLSDAEKDLKILKFDKADKIWLEFVCTNRLGKNLPESFDIIIGPVANDAVYTTILFYENGLYDEDEAIKRLKVQKLYNQVLFHTEKSLQYCQYIRHEVVGE